MTVLSLFSAPSSTLSLSVSCSRVWPKKARSVVLLSMSTTAGRGSENMLAGNGVSGTRLAQKLFTRIDDRLCEVVLLPPISCYLPKVPTYRPTGCGDAPALGPFTANAICLPSGETID